MTASRPHPHALCTPSSAIRYCPSYRRIIVMCRRAPQNALQCQGERDACIKCYSGATGPDGVLACVDVVDAFNKCAVATSRKGSKKE
jgi:hypothetical protein